jgi:hypothetical protein
MAIGGPWDAIPNWHGLNGYGWSDALGWVKISDAFLDLEARVGDTRPPWEIAGMKRSTWYRRRKERLNGQEAS